MASDSTTPTSSPTKADRNVANEAFNYLVQGKRHLLVRDIPSAVSSLQQACQLLTGHYGELGNECGDAYFYYGKALFEQAREETGVLGNAIEEQEQEDEEEEEEEEQEEEEEEDEDGDGEQDEQQQDEGEDEEDQSDKSEELGDDEKDAPTTNEASNNSEAQPAPTPSTELDPQPGTSAGGSGTNNKGEEEEEEITNLQLAWEVLELAKIIYSRQAENSREVQLKLADVHLQLGEVSLESGNFSEAINDMERCMRIQEELLHSDDRRIAETHYHLAIAYTYNNSYDQAIQNFQRACEVIESKVASLRLITAGKQVEPGNVFVNEDDPVAVAQRDIDELTAILPEIREKISDMEDAKRVMNLMNMSESNGAEEKAVEKTPVKSSPSAAPISNIGHLVKRKRKLDDHDEDKSIDSENKKSRPDSTLEYPGTSSSSSLLCTPSDEVTESAAAVEHLITSQNECRGTAPTVVDSELPSSSGSTITSSSADASNSTMFDDPVSSSTDCRASRWSNRAYRSSEAVQSVSRDTWNGEISQSESAANE